MQKLIKIVACLWVLNSAPTYAISLTSLLPESQGSVFSFAAGQSIFSAQKYSTKKGKAYSEADDPAFHANGPDTPTPQHGYFAVPLIVFGVAALFIYVLKND